MKTECSNCEGQGVIQGACLIPPSHYAPAEYEALDCPNPLCHDGEVEAEEVEDEYSYEPTEEEQADAMLEVDGR